MPKKPYPPLPENPILIPSPSDIILAGDSSDEESPAAKRAKNQRILGYAQNYLSGQQLYIHSARLRGPVINNPWGKGARQTKGKPVARMEEKHKSKKRKALCEDDEREIPRTPTQKPEWAVWGTERRRGDKRTILESSPEVEGFLRSACSSPGESIASRPIMSRDEAQGEDMQVSVVFSNDVTPVATPANRKEKHKQRLPPPPAFSPGSFYKKLGTKPTPGATPRPALKPAPKNKTKPTKQTSRSVSHSPACGSRGRASVQSHTPSAAVSRWKSKPGESDESIHDVVPEADRVMPLLAPADAKKKRIRINFTTMSPFTNQPTGTGVESKKTPKKRRKKADSGVNKDLEDHPSKSVARDQATEELSTIETARQAAGEHVGSGIDRNVIENRQSDTGSEARDENVEIVTSEAPPIGNFASHTYVYPVAVRPHRPHRPHRPQVFTLTGCRSEPLSSGGSVSLQLAQRTTPFVSPSPILTASGEGFTGDSHSKVTPVAKLLTGKTASPDRVASADHIGGQKVDPTAIEKPPKQDTTAISSAVASEPPQFLGQSYFSAPEVLRNGKGIEDEEDPEPYQSTQTQLMAAKKGFFDALNDSPFFPQSKLSTTAEETPSVLRPDSFNLDASKTPTLSFGGSWRNRGKITDTDSASFKTPVPRSNWKPSGDIQVPGTNSPPPPSASTAFAQTIDTPKPSTPEGTTFTPFAAFATPNATPEPTQKDISPLTFSPLRNVTQHPPHQESGTKPYVKFVGFGLLDEDEDATSLDLAPNSFPKPGQGASDEKEDLVKEVMGFMGQQVWDIDEELKKMAGGNQSTKSTDAGKKRRGLRR